MAEGDPVKREFGFLGGVNSIIGFVALTVLATVPVTTFAQAGSGDGQRGWALSDPVPFLRAYYGPSFHERFEVTGSAAVGRTTLRSRETEVMQRIEIQAVVANCQLHRYALTIPLNWNGEETGVKLGQASIIDFRMVIGAEPTQVAPQLVFRGPKIFCRHAWSPGHELRGVIDCSDAVVFGAEGAQVQETLELIDSSLDPDCDKGGWKRDDG